MTDLKSPTLIYLKGCLFLGLGLLAAGLLLAKAGDWSVAVLLAITIWAFCRTYYFAFYVIEHYVDPGYHFAGLGSFVRYLCCRPTKATSNAFPVGPAPPDGSGKPSGTTGPVAGEWTHTEVNSRAPEHPAGGA